jgi:hypothetical protein
MKSHVNADMNSGAANPISTEELRQLLQSLQGTKAGASFRCRVLAKLWIPAFARVVSIEAKRLVLFDEVKCASFTIEDLEYIIQFEIDQRHRQFEPHLHYTIRNISQGKQPKPTARFFG